MLTAPPQNVIQANMYYIFALPLQRARGQEESNVRLVNRVCNTVNHCPLAHSQVCVSVVSSRFRLSSRLFAKYQRLCIQMTFYVSLARTIGLMNWFTWIMIIMYAYSLADLIRRANMRGGHTLRCYCNSIHVVSVFFSHECEIVDGTEFCWIWVFDLRSQSRKQRQSEGEERERVSHKKYENCSHQIIVQPIYR